MGIQGQDLAGRLCKAQDACKQQNRSGWETKLLAWFPGKRNRQRDRDGETGFQCVPFFYFHIFFIVLTHNFSKITFKSEGRVAQDTGRWNHPM